MKKKKFNQISTTDHPLIYYTINNIKIDNTKTTDTINKFMTEVQKNKF